MVSRTLSMTLGRAAPVNNSRIAALAGLALNRQTPAFARDRPVLCAVSQLSVASRLQEVVEVAVFHALEERADFVLAED